MLMQTDFSITLQQSKPYVAQQDEKENLTIEQDTVDCAILPPKSPADLKQVPSIETLNSEMPRKELQKDRGKKAFKCLLNILRMKKYGSATISKPDPVYRVAYLGNVITGWAKGEGCFEKPLTTLWRNYTQSSRPDVRMNLTISGGGLKATTKDHGLTEYWANRLTACGAPAQFPRLFCWVYRHEGKRLRHELRCHAVLCSSSTVAKQIAEELKESLALALLEFKREKLCRQNARLSLVNSVYENPTIPRRKILLSTGSHNYRPPLERSKSAPKLMSIEEIIEEEDDNVFDNSKETVNAVKKLLNHCNSSSSLLDRRKWYLISQIRNNSNIVPAKETTCDESLKEEKPEELEHLMLDDKSDVILNELVENSLKNDLLESCEKAWYNALSQKPDLIPIESDEGSLSSGCESASTAMSEAEHPIFPTITELGVLQEEEPEYEKKTELDFKVGGAVLSRVRSFEKLSNPDLLKYCRINNKKQLLDQEEVSLVPVGETHADFSSLKVFKRRTLSDPNYRRMSEGNASDDEIGSACSDESGYEEEDIISSIGNIVLV